MPAIAKVIIKAQKIGFVRIFDSCRTRFTRDNIAGIRLRRCFIRAGRKALFNQSEQMKLFKNGRVDLKFASEALAAEFIDTYLGTVC